MRTDTSSGVLLSRRGSNGLPSPFEMISICACEAYLGVSMESATTLTTPTTSVAISSFGSTRLTAVPSAARSMSSGEAGNWRAHDGRALWANVTGVAGSH